MVLGPLSTNNGETVLGKGEVVYNSSQSCLQLLLGGKSTVYGKLRALLKISGSVQSTAADIQGFASRTDKETCS
jgi:hypothetical protein